SGYGEAESRALVGRIVEAMRAVPEVESAGVSTALLLGPGSWNTRFTVATDRRFVIEDAVHCSAVGPGLFETLGATIVAGRAVDERDRIDAGKREFRSAVVNERLAR